jgi:hypothetical protein
MNPTAAPGALALLVIAKEPRPGFAKTRLTPPCTAEQAAVIAEAALADTLEAVAAVPAGRHVLALDGEPGSWLPPGFEIVAQQGAGLADRLGHAFTQVDGPALLVGMDTPQVSSAQLADAARRLLRPGTDAVLGPAADGGFWSIGLMTPDASVFEGVPMSAPDTGERQLARLRHLGLRTGVLATLRDVDHLADAIAVAAEAPGGRFAAAVAAAVGSSRPVTS